MKIWDGFDDGEILFSLNKTAAPPPEGCAGGGGATAVATVENGAVTGITVTNGGSGYCGQPQVFIAGGEGSGATATAVLAPDATNMLSAAGDSVGGPYQILFHVTSVAVTNGGSGYRCPPAVSIGKGQWPVNGGWLDGRPTPMETYTNKVIQGVFDPPGNVPDQADYWIEYSNVTAAFNLVNRVQKRDDKGNLSVDMFQFLRIRGFPLDASHSVDSPAELMGGNSVIDAILDAQPVQVPGNTNSVTDYIRFSVGGVSMFYRSTAIHVAVGTGWQEYMPSVLNVDRVNKTATEYEVWLDSYGVGNCPDQP